MVEIICVSVPYFLGEKLPDRTETEQIKSTGFADKIQALWVELKPDYEKHIDPVIAVNTALAETISTHQDRFPVVFAADCVSSLGMVKGLSHHEDIGIIWLDAHGDFNTPETTPSGFLGGMPMAILVGRGNQHLMQGMGLQPIPENRIVATDMRDLDPEEGIHLHASQVAVYHHVNELLTADLPTHPVYIHLDVDVLDPQFMPALGYPAPNGPSLDEVTATLRHVARKVHVAGLLVSLWNGDKAANDIPLNNTLHMVQAILNELT